MQVVQPEVSSISRAIRTARQAQDALFEVGSDKFLDVLRSNFGT